MLNGENVILSIIVISHNQCELLRRCLESIFRQELSSPFEVIVSDDRSSDGTREMLETEYADRVIFTCCNSDKCHPAMTSERASYNRQNGLKLARGKYLIHVDGDDFYTSSDIFQTLVDTLENHPECTIAHQNYRIKEENSTVEYAPLAFPQNWFEGYVISADEFIQRFEYIHNSACCMRRSEVSWSDLLRSNYDDYDITFAYLKQGKVALVNRADFIYCTYQQQTASKFAAVDQQVCWTTEIPLMLEFPEYSGSLLYRGLKPMLKLIILALANVELQESTMAHLRTRDAFLVQVFLGKKKFVDILRLRVARLYIRCIRHFMWSGEFVYKMLYRLCIQFNVSKNVCFKR